MTAAGDGAGTDHPWAASAVEIADSRPVAERLADLDPIARARLRRISAMLRVLGVYAAALAGVTAFLTARDVAGDLSRVPPADVLWAIPPLVASGAALTLAIACWARPRGGQAAGISMGAGLVVLGVLSSASIVNVPLGIAALALCGRGRGLFGADRFRHRDLRLGCGDRCLPLTRRP